MLAQLATLLAVAGLSTAQAVYECDSLQRPNYESCDVVAQNYVPWDQSPEEGESIPDGYCDNWSEAGNIGNCIISVCNFRGDGVAQPYNVLSGRTGYNLVKQWCAPDGAGGQSPGTGGNRATKAINNPGYQGSPSRVKRSATGGQMHRLTIAETEALAEAGRQANRINTRSDLIKRQDPSWISLGISRNVQKDGIRSRMSAVGTPGASQQWSTEEGYSTSVSISAGFEASLFSFFTASVGIETTLETSVSYTYTLTFNPSERCDPNQESVLYFNPLFDRYLGMWSDNQGVEHTVEVPVEGSNNYALTVECLG